MAQLVLLLLSRYKGDKKEQMKSFDELQIDLEDEILKLFGRVNCNAFSLANDLTNEEVGIGLFPEGALFNHDCDPNCVVSFKGREMLVHVVKDVRKDEELTVSYVELLQSTKKRRSELKGSYFFDCECTRCQASVEKEEDWYLDGLECYEEDIARYERGFKAIEALEAKTEQDQWEIYQQKWELAT
ncbi:Histone-lysine N-methyltransferase, partial [Phytophthora megakarya]